jgi:hypothetical protein
MAISTVVKSALSTFDKFQRVSAGNPGAPITSAFVINAAGSMFSSADGITWTSRGSTSFFPIFKKNGFLIVSTGTSANSGWSSTNGTSWTSLGAQNVGLTGSSKQIPWANGVYSEDNQLLIPELGPSQREAVAGDAYIVGTSSPIRTIKTVGRFGNHITTANVNNSPFISYSTNGGATWADGGTGIGGGINNHWVGPNGVVVATQSNLLYTSTDYGANFTLRQTMVAGGAFMVKRINNLWIVSNGGGSNSIYTSTDAITWTTVTHSLGSGFYDGTYANGTWVLVGENGKILTSTDGVSWTSRTSGTASTIGNIVYV